MGVTAFSIPFILGGESEGKDVLAALEFRKAKIPLVLHIYLFLLRVFTLFY